MKRIFTIMTLSLLLSIAMTNVVLADSFDSSVNLYRKDGSSWEVEEGAWGTLSFNEEGESFDFSFVGSSVSGDHTLIRYVDPWDTHQAICFGSATPNSSGDVLISGSLDIDSFTDAKFWLVPSSHVDCSTEKMTTWDASKYLFEENLISFTKVEEQEEVIDVEEVEESTPSVKNTFHKDSRCVASKPADVTWTRHVGDELLWSAVGGDKVEVRFGFTPSDLLFHFVTSNDGHETTGIGTDIGWWSGFWQIRTLNGCREGNWTPVMTGTGSW